MSDVTTVDQLLAEDSFDGVTFSGLELERLSISDKELVGCTFLHCKAAETRWQRTRLEDCVFDGCDLTSMKPQGMIPRDVHFRQSKLLGVDWSDLAQLPRLAFTESILHYASFVKLDLRRIKFLGCELTEAAFTEVDLTEADFSGSSLRGATFQKCRLGKADFSGARELYFDPSANQVRGALIPVETAVLIAMQLGMRVSGYDAPAKSREASSARAGRRRR